MYIAYSKSFIVVPFRPISIKSYQIQKKHEEIQNQGKRIFFLNFQQQKLMLGGRQKKKVL